MTRRPRPRDPLLPDAVPAAAALLGSAGLHAASRFLRLVPPPGRAAWLPLAIAMYALAVYLLILAPGTLYAALVTGTQEELLRTVAAYVTLAAFVFCVKFGREALREWMALFRRERLGFVLHGM